MGSRPDLHRELENLLGTKNCYFQPPESVKIKYDCIVYNRTSAQNDRADNDSYLYTASYRLTFITKNPDSPIIDEIPKRFKYCRMVNNFTRDNLNHYIYDLYY